MAHSIKDPQELQGIYKRRFDRRLAYRQRLWQTLTNGFFQRYVGPDAVVLDLALRV